MALNANFSLLFVAVMFCIGGSRCDVNVTDYLFWKKADIQMWHEFFPSRALEEEQRTIAAGLVAVDSLSRGLKESMFAMLDFQRRELQTAEEIMKDTPAEGCVNGISDFINTSINDAVETYLNCAADAPSKLTRQNSTWARNWNTYTSTYQRALRGIDACNRTYPNRDQIGRLMSCVESMSNNYLKSAQATQAAMFPSPSMSYFESGVITCLSQAVEDMLEKGKQFLDMLGSCAELAKDYMDITDYKYQLSTWKPYVDKLIEEVKNAQQRNYDQINIVESQMTKYWEEQKLMVENSVLQNRDLSYYKGIIYKMLADYYNTITSTSIDNPGDLSCIDMARAELDAYAAQAANSSLACDSKMVNATRQVVAEVFEKFRELNWKMPGVGNPTLLKCFSVGYIFAPYTITKCFNLSYTEFKIEYWDRYGIIASDTEALYKYQSTFECGDLPCGGSSKSRLLLAGETVLYKLQRCLYSGYGTTYDVTTPTPWTSGTTYDDTTPTLWTSTTEPLPSR